MLGCQNSTWKKRMLPRLRVSLFCQLVIKILPLCKCISLAKTLASRDRCYDFKNIFAEKNSEKLAFLTRNKAKSCKKSDHNIGFWENANFFAENWQISQKIVAITSTPVPTYMSDPIEQPRGQCYDFGNIFAEKEAILIRKFYGKNWSPRKATSFV
jgi:hypothetical protein